MEEKKYLETTFWSDNEKDSDDDNEDDEGIGSDESMEHCSCFDNEEPNRQKIDSLKKKEKNSQGVRRLLRGLKHSKVLSKSLSHLYPKKIFGASLPSDTIPQIVTWCTTIIEERTKEDISSLEGVYRLSGQVSHIKALKMSFDAGHLPSQQAVSNIHSVGSLLKVCSRNYKNVCYGKTILLVYLTNYIIVIGCPGIPLQFTTINLSICKH